MEKNLVEENKKELPTFEKIINLTKLGSVCLAADRIDKAIEILQKTLTFYEEKINAKEIPNFFYSILYSNLAKAYSVKKEFKVAEPLYTKAILNHPIYKILLKNAEEINKSYLIGVDKLLDVDPKLDLSLVEKQFEVVYDFFKNNSVFHFTEKFKPNNLNSISSFTDSLINLAVIFQIQHKETNTAFNMYSLAILIEPNNEVANIDFNNYLREVYFH
jgi:tetratricopeptide (TPR) repeat protein